MFPVMITTFMMAREKAAVDVLMLDCDDDDDDESDDDDNLLDVEI